MFKYRKLILILKFFTFITLIQSVYSQNKNSSKDTNSINILLKKSEQVLFINPDSSFYYANKALSIAESIKNKNKIFDSYNRIGISRAVSGDFEKALLYFNKALKITNKNTIQEADILSNIGIIFDDLGNYKQSLEYNLKALKIREKLKDENGINNSMNNIGLIYMNQKEPKKALQYYQKCLKIDKKNNDEEGISSCLNNIGGAYLLLKNYAKSLEYFNKSLDIQKKLNQLGRIAGTYNNIAQVYKLNGDFNKAEYYFSEGLKIRREIKDQYGEIQSLSKLGSFYFDVKNYQLSLKYCQECYEKANKLNALPVINESAQCLSKNYEVEKNYNLAFKFHKIFKETQDSIFNESKFKEMAYLESNYEFEKKQAVQEIEYSKNLSIERKDKEKQQIVIVLTTIGLILVILFLLIIYKRLKISNAQKKEIQKQKTIVDHKNREILDSITYAKRIQSAILPQPKLVKQFLEDSFVLYKPKDIVAGDFYWLEVVGDTVLFAAADCTGHGVPGAMVSVVCNNGLNRSVREHKLIMPNEILNKTRALVVEEFEKSDEEVKDGMDISLCALNTNTNQLYWSGANNPLWVLRKNGEIIEYKADKQPIGKHFDSKPFSLVEYQLEKNDIIYIFTDGYQDQFGGPKEKKFRASQMKELFLSLANHTMEKQREIIDTTFEEWRGDLEQVDDVCVIGVRI
jgi:serine phosphatase RsbU (regulator of sigma subunit)/Tfp pilus assembly protein PilF